MFTIYGSLLFKSFRRVAPKLNFFPKFSFVKTNNLFKALQKKSFSEEKTFHLDQSEAYLWNEHDRMVVQLNSNVVPMTALPKFMKELLEICIVLNKYRDYVKGWDYAAKFFHENLKNFTNEDLYFYISAMALNNYPATISNFYSDIGKEVLSRTLDKNIVLDLMSSFLLSHSNDQEFWIGIVRKVEGYTNLQYEDNIRLAALLGETQISASDPIWETILSKVENSNVVKGDIPLTYYLRAAYALKQRVQRDSPFYSNVIIFVEKNIKSVPADFVASFLNLWTKFKGTIPSDVVEILGQTFPLLKNATDYGKFEFYKLVFDLCLENPNLRNTLESSKAKIGENFFVPSSSFITDYGNYVSQATTYKSDALKKAHERFWSTHAQKIGLKESQAIAYSTIGFTNFDTMTDLSKNIKLE